MSNGIIFPSRCFSMISEFSTMNYIQLLSSGKSHVKNLILLNYLLCITRDARNQSSSCTCSLSSVSRTSQTLFNSSPSIPEGCSSLRHVHLVSAIALITNLSTRMSHWVRFSSSPIWSINSFVNLVNCYWTSTLC